MNIFADIVLVSFVAMFIENTIFARALGTSTMLLAAKNKKHLVGFGVCITYISVVSSVISFFADEAFLVNESFALYMPLIYVAIIALVYILTLLVMWKFANKTFLALKKFIHISAFNCAVLGALLLNSQHGNTLLEYVGFGLGTGLGFMIAAYFLSVVYERLYSEDVPESFRGLPLVLIYIGILSMAFYGLIGHRLTL